jgi:hypothetical protein
VLWMSELAKPVAISEEPLNSLIKKSKDTLERKYRWAGHSQSFIPWEFLILFQPHSWSSVYP